MGSRACGSWFTKVRFKCWPCQTDFGILFLAKSGRQDTGAQSRSISECYTQRNTNQDTDTNTLSSNDFHSTALLPRQKTFFDRGWMNSCFLCRDAVPEDVRCCLRSTGVDRSCSEHCRRLSVATEQGVPARDLTSP